MSDLISRQDAIDVFEILAEKMSDEGQTVMAQAVAVLKDLRSAGPERKKGKWVKYKTLSRGYGQIYYQHDCCPNLYESPYHFCPNCGAEMEGE